MTTTSVISLGQSAMEVTIMLVAVMLIPALIVGLMVSMFQAATQINEQTLSFIPKLFVVFFVIIAAAPWMLQLITSFTVRLFNSIPTLIG